MNAPPEYDTVRVFFDDGSSTTINVLSDDSIPDAIADLCEHEGWPLKDVTGYTVEG